MVIFRETNDSDTSNLVVEKITTLNPDLSDYQPQLVLVVTWFDMGYHLATNVPENIRVSIVVHQHKNFVTYFWRGRVHAIYFSHLLPSCSQ